MSLNRQRTSAGGVIVLIIFILTAILLKNAMVNGVQWNPGLYFLIPFLLASLIFLRKRR